MGWNRVSRFMGSKQVTSLVDGEEEDKPYEDAVATGDVPIAILANKITAETNDTRKAVLEQQLLEELQVIKHFINIHYACVCLAPQECSINDA